MDKFDIYLSYLTIYLHIILDDKYGYIINKDAIN
jgi:hypothetical protein